MPAEVRNIAIGICAAMTAAFGPFAVLPAIASKPVPRTIVGCVFDGILITSDGYEIRPKDASGRPIELRKFEGRELTIGGDLLPADVLLVKKAPRDTGRCKMPRPAGR